MARALYDDNRDVFVLVFEHGSFEPLAQREVIPAMSVEMSRTIAVGEQGAE